MFIFTPEQQTQFHDFLDGLNAQNSGTWPDAAQWPTWPGLPAYTCTQHGHDLDGPWATVVKFDYTVRLGLHTGTRFAVGSRRLLPPTKKYIHRLSPSPSSPPLTTNH